MGGAKQWGRIYHGYDQSSRGSDIEALYALFETVESELFNACSQGGLTRYAFGNEPEPGRCIDATWVDEGGSLEVTSAESRDCHGQSPPFDAIHDLSGSVGDWQNVCGYWPGGRSSVIGCGRLYSSRSKQEPMDCATYGHGLAKDITPLRGFRCCADSVLVP